VQHVEAEDILSDDMAWQRQYLLLGKDSTKYTASRDTWGPLVLPSGMIFVLGDNRDQSLDSRFVGFVRERDVVGRAQRLYWSWDSVARKVRWNRIGLTVRTPG
jgi:signal peptidase I